MKTPFFAYPHPLKRQQKLRAQNCETISFILQQLVIFAAWIDPVSWNPAFFAPQHDH
jgi:hypothetical protein